MKFSIGSRLFLSLSLVAGLSMSSLLAMDPQKNDAQTLIKLQTIFLNKEEKYEAFCDRAYEIAQMLSHSQNEKVKDTALALLKEQENICGICQGPISQIYPLEKESRFDFYFDGDTLKNCVHRYHPWCSDTWLNTKTNNKCPVCRAPRFDLTTIEGQLETLEILTTYVREKKISNQLLAKIIAAIEKTKLSTGENVQQNLLCLIIELIDTKGFDKSQLFPFIHTIIKNTHLSTNENVQQNLLLLIIRLLDTQEFDKSQLIPFISGIVQKTQLSKNEDVQARLLFLIHSLVITPEFDKSQVFAYIPTIVENTQRSTAQIVQNALILLTCTLRKTKEYGKKQANALYFSILEANPQLRKLHEQKNRKLRCNICLGATATLLGVGAVVAYKIFFAGK